MTTKTFPGNFKSLEPISKFVILKAQEVGFSPSEIYSIQTAVDEACANIIDHAYGGENIGDIVISITTSQDRISIVMQDTGDPFDPEAVPEPDVSSPLEIRKERGLGIFFMYKLMDEVEFEFSQSKGNSLTLIKYKGK